MPKYFDIHCHLNSHEYDEDREAVMERLALSETSVIVVGTDFESSKWAVELAEKHENVYACIGVHPAEGPEHKGFNKSEGWDELMKRPKVVAIGECGIDLFKIDKEKDYERQKKLFIEQIEFALEHDKPIMIHSRDAYDEVLEILEPLVRLHGHKLRGNSHFFTGTLEQAKRYWAIGFTTSFTGVITFALDYDEVIKNAPMDMIMSETDAPWVSPTPYRGKRNEPSYVSEVVKKIAEIRGEDEILVQKTLVENALRMFQITLA